MNRPDVPTDHPLATLARLLDEDAVATSLPLGEALAELGHERLAQLALVCAGLLEDARARAVAEQIVRGAEAVEGLSAVSPEARAAHRRRRAN
jgi:hypothetical protein